MQQQGQGQGQSAQAAHTVKAYMSGVKHGYRSSMRHENVRGGPTTPAESAMLAEREASRILADVEPVQAHRVPLDALLVMRARGSKGETLASLAVGALSAFVAGGGAGL